MARSRHILIFLLFFVKCRSQSDTCLNFSTCGECIQQPECVWCQNPKDDGTNCRNNGIKEEWCNTNDKILANASLHVIENENLSSQVQMKPQSISLKIPRNQIYSIDFQFARAENPLDLYFLMDASYTMKPYKDILATLGQKLVDGILEHTSDFKIGFGSFVDKTVYPFDYHEYESPECESCDRGYSFINHLSLTKDTDAFGKEVINSKTASNLDQPEGGLEALMQAIVCTDEIGWRPEATKLIIFATDDFFHVAGDGRLAGVLYPNDGLCHMSEHNYTKDKELDYPSVSHLSHMAQEYNIHIIFAIAIGEDSEKDKELKDNIQMTYKEFHKHVALSKYDILEQNSDGIIKIVIETYKQILQSVKMTHNFPPEIDVDFKVKCPKASIETDGSSCVDLTIGQAVDFKATIKPLRCFKRGEPSQFKIQADGINDALIIDLEVICECDCEKNINDMKPDATCYNQGYNTCGICVCMDGYSGRNCQCSSTTTGIDESTCIDPQTNRTCNGNGECECGVCKCVGNYYGTFCSCEDFSCPKNNYRLCNGEDHGTCKCGHCECLPGWTKDDCSCPISNKQCIAPYSDGLVCSGKGLCTCGKCQCDEDYFGDFCEGCTGCEWCADLDPCVEEYISDTPRIENTNLIINCSSVIIIPRENATTSSYDSTWSKCLLQGKEGCNTVYRYKLEETRILIEIGEEICPFVASIQGILLAVLLPIFIGGMFAFLAWKAVVTYKDKNEYANFLKKRDQEKWNTELNPLFKTAKVHYPNPMFKKNT